MSEGISPSLGLELPTLLFFLVNITHGLISWSDLRWAQISEGYLQFLKTFFWPRLFIFLNGRNRYETFSTRFSWTRRWTWKKNSSKNLDFFLSKIYFEKKFGIFWKYFQFPLGILNIFSTNSELFFQNTFSTRKNHDFLMSFFIKFISWSRRIA